MQTLDSGNIGNYPTEGSRNFGKRRAFSYVTNEHRPLARGWLHAAAALIWFPLSLLIMHMSEPIYRQPLTIYLLAVLSTLTISAIYHILAISAAKQKLWQRLDHAGVFILILGSYVPVSYAVLTSSAAAGLVTIVTLLSVVGGVLRGLGKCKKFASSLYIVTGWVGLLILPELLKTSISATILMFIGGVFYTIGAVFFKNKWPLRSSEFFGYHEIFHLCTIIGILTQYYAIMLLTT